MILQNYNHSLTPAINKMLCSRIAAVACVVVVASLVWSHAEGACQPGQFDCTGAGTVCVSQQQVCDGQKNCAGGQDENPASCGCIKAVGPNPGPGRVVRAPGPNKGPVSTRPGASACVCIASNVSSVVCGCAVGFVSDGQNGCKTAPPTVNQPLSRPSTRPPPAVNATAPATPGPRTRPGAPATPGPRTRPGAPVTPGPRTRPGAPATPGPRMRPGAPASPNPPPSTKPRGTSAASTAAPANPARR